MSMHLTKKHRTVCSHPVTHTYMCVCVCVCRVCVCVCARARACVRACMRACVRVALFVFTSDHIALLGLILSSPMEEAHALARHVADFVLVFSCPLCVRAFHV